MAGHGIAEHAVEHLRQSEQRFRFVADLIPQLIFTANPSGSMNYYSQCWIHYTGLSVDEAKGGGWTRAVHADDLPGLTNQWAEAVRTGQDYQAKLRLRRASDGTYRWFVGQAWALRDEAQAILQWVATCTEIGEQELSGELLDRGVEERAQELSRARQQLQTLLKGAARVNEAGRGDRPGRVDRWNVALHPDEAEELIRVFNRGAEDERKRSEWQLEQRKLQLEAVNKELEEFAYVASHDLKAPLRVIDNASKWLEEDLQEHLTEDARESLELMRSRIQRMEKLLDDLLEYARIGRGTDQRYQETVNGEALLADVVALLNPGRLEVVVSPKFKQIEVSRMPLQQIFMNLVSNAIKHHDKPVGRIEVTMEEEKEAYVFGVKDDGPGIPERFYGQIFKMFQTLRPRDQVEGSGMGLSLVRKHVEVSGGMLWLESEPGKGSAFRFTWPKLGSAPVMAKMQWDCDEPGDGMKLEAA